MTTATQQKLMQDAIDKRIEIIRQAREFEAGAGNRYDKAQIVAQNGRIIDYSNGIIRGLELAFSIINNF